MPPFPAKETPEPLTGKGVLALSLRPETMGVTTDGNATPRLDYYPLPATGAPGPAVIVVPGGGYEFLAHEHEGSNVARWFRERGVAAFVLFYRLPAQGHRHPAPLEDIQRAVRVVRRRSREWGIDPARVAVLGFSAGGHLVTTLATHFDLGNPHAAETAARESSRPDFAVAVYPVVTLRTPGLTHEGSKRNLLGEQPDLALVDDLSNETRVTAGTPPLLLVHSVDDVTVPIENSRLMLEALQRAGVPSELHEYPHGGHGFGLAENSNAPPGWLDRVLSWLDTAGFGSSLADCPPRRGLV